jgi:hypothetical protein
MDVKIINLRKNKKKIVERYNKKEKMKIQKYILIIQNI